MAVNRKLNISLAQADAIGARCSQLKEGYVIEGVCRRMTSQNLESARRRQAWFNLCTYFYYSRSVRSFWPSSSRLSAVISSDDADGWITRISKENCIVSRCLEPEVFRSWWRMSERLQRLWYPLWQPQIWRRLRLPLALKVLPAAALIFAVGLLDDLRAMRPWPKLAVQVIASYVAFDAGIRISRLGGFAVPPWLSLPLTVSWLVGCCNAFNLIDGVDGLATGAGLFASVTMLLGALLNNDTLLAMATVPLAGALLGFLWYNFNPASIFLGDSGSLTLGFLLGCYGTIWNQKSTTVLGITAPLMALAVPLLDTGISIARRFLRQQPIFSADFGHIHHRLLARGLTPRRVVLLLYGASGVAAVMSLLASVSHNGFKGIDYRGLLRCGVDRHTASRVC